MNERYRSSAATGCDSDKTHDVQSVSESDLDRLLLICRSFIQPSMLVSLHLSNEGCEVLESKLKYVVCVAVACFGFVFWMSLGLLLCGFSVFASTSHVRAIEL